jgi:hypothetical protein
MNKNSGDPETVPLLFVPFANFVKSPGPLIHCNNFSLVSPLTLSLLLLLLLLLFHLFCIIVSICLLTWWCRYAFRISNSPC